VAGTTCLVSHETKIKKKKKSKNSAVEYNHV
jgi:hypothetical protein